MYHTRKIGVFVSHIFGYYQTNVCQGIVDKASEYGYTVEIFSSLDGENLGAYGIGETSILRIPNFNNLDGIIFAAGTYLSDELRQKIIVQLSNCSCPVVEFPVEEPSFPSIVLDNNRNTMELVDHLIDVHHYNRICFLGCSQEVTISNLRESFFKKAMGKHMRPIGTYDIFNCDYSKESIFDALDFFIKAGKPDAVICYNDRIALNFMEVALSKGYRIPEDIAITGFDDSFEGRDLSPRLTTVSFPVYELGVAATETLISRIRGNEIPKTTIVHTTSLIHNSCGCNNSPVKNTSAAILAQNLSKRIANLEHSIFNSMKMSTTLQHINDIDEGMDLLEEYIYKIEHCQEFYLCLYSDWNSVSNHIMELTDSLEDHDNQEKQNNIILKFALKNGKRLPECSYQKKNLLPDYIYENSGSAYVYTPLFFGDKEFGYMALAFESDQLSFPFQLVQWQMNINQMLQALWESRRTGLLVARLEEIYMKDPLTGLLNKHGYNHHEETLLSRAIAEKKHISAFLIDMNGLKKINDTYGHLEGDFAIKVMGHALESTIGMHDICARFSGDEFYLLSVDKDDAAAKSLIEKIHLYLENYNKLSTKEYIVSCSCGYASTLPGPEFTSDNVQELFARADQMMYENKARYHAEHD